MIQIEINQITVVSSLTSCTKPISFRCLIMFSLRSMLLSIFIQNTSGCVSFLCHLQELSVNASHDMQQMSKILNCIVNSMHISITGSNLFDIFVLQSPTSKYLNITSAESGGEKSKEFLFSSHLMIFKIALVTICQKYLFCGFVWKYLYCICTFDLYKRGWMTLRLVNSRSGQHPMAVQYR